MPGKTAKKSLEKAAQPASGPSRSRSKEYLAVVVFAAAAFLMVCLLSYDPRDPSFNVVTHRLGLTNLGGLVGSYIADALVQVLGMSALLVPVALVTLAAKLLALSVIPFRWTAAFSTLALLSVTSALLERFNVGSFLGVVATHPGGTVGAWLHTSFFKFFGSVGEIIVGCTFGLLSVLHILRISLKRFARFLLWVATRPVVLAMLTWWKVKAVLSGWRDRRRSLALSADRARRSTSADTEESDSVTSRAGVQDEGRASVPVPQDMPPLPWERVPLFPKSTSDFPDTTDESTSQDQQSLETFASQRENTPVRVSELREIPAATDVPPRESQDEDGRDEEQDQPPVAVKSPLKRVPLVAAKVPARSPIEHSDGEDEQDEYDLVTATPGPTPAWKPLQVVEPAETVPVPCHSRQDMEEAIEHYLRDEMAREQAIDKAAAASHPNEAPEPSRPIRVTKRADEEPAPVLKNRLSPDPGGDYVLPPTDLLDTPPPSTRSVDQKVLEQNAAILEQKLADLGIRGEVVEIHPGPVITMYEVSLAAGIPLRKVLSTSDDLAMALKSGSTRVVAPIPGKDTVGIEVPNLQREIVYFREIVESQAFMELTAPLKVALGKGIDGTPFATSLVRMPHLLIAGATGTGKSVGLNCLICSWLMSCSPDDVKFLMVDPKRLELSYYQDIPHLIHPVVTETEKVPKVLNWAIREMERRYELLSKTGAKNIESYNQKVAAVQAANDSDEPAPEKLPFIVIIVDELAELMMVAAKDIEISIARLAQMARASGIHLILATQRPSVDVITGVIKANFPARLSYQVSAKPDSRTILDTTGAEHLLGMGDMLFLPPGTAKLARLHGAYVSEDEIRNIVDFIKAQRSPVYLKEIEKLVAEGDSTGAGAELPDDPKYDEALELVTRLGHASISLIQRHMRIGYNRAARIIEAMEGEGIIGPSDGTSRPREVRAPSLDSIPDSAPF
jgi:DNA segregation ATPase FtsK/SpoIIIE-like protein